MAKASAKTHGKSRGKLEPQPHGGALSRDGTPGHRGAGGRPRNDFRERMSKLADAKELDTALQEILKDSEHKHFPFAVQFVADRAHGKAAQPVEHSGEIVHRVEYTDEDTGE